MLKETSLSNGNKQTQTNCKFRIQNKKKVQNTCAINDVYHQEAIMAQHVGVIRKLRHNFFGV